MLFSQPWFFLGTGLVLVALGARRLGGVGPPERAWARCLLVLPIVYLAAVAWDAPRDPTIYGVMEVRAEALLAWLDLKRRETGQHLTITHAVVRALAMSLARYPDCNATVRLGRPVLRRDVDIFAQVAIPREGQIGASDLSGTCIRRADTKRVLDIAAELQAGARAIRSGQDKALQSTKRQLDLIPGLRSYFASQTLSDANEDMLAARVNGKVWRELKLGLLGRLDRGYNFGSLAVAEATGPQTLRTVSGTFQQMWYAYGGEARYSFPFLLPCSSFVIHPFLSNLFSEVQLYLQFCFQ